MSRGLGDVYKRQPLYCAVPGPGDLIVLKHSSYRQIFQCPLSLVSDLHICWKTVGCSLRSSDQLGISLALRGSGLHSHTCCRHLLLSILYFFWLHLQKDFFFFTSFSEISLLVYRKTGDFCRLILYPATLFCLFIDSNSFFDFLFHLVYSFFDIFIDYVITVVPFPPLHTTPSCPPYPSHIPPL